MYASLFGYPPIEIYSLTNKVSKKRVKYVFTKNKAAILFESDTLAIESLDSIAYRSVFDAYSILESGLNRCESKDFKLPCDTIILSNGKISKTISIKESECGFGVSAKICILFEPYFAVRRKYENSICIINDLIIIHNRYDSLLKAVNNLDMRKVPNRHDDSLYSLYDYHSLGKDFFIGFDSMKKERNISIPLPDESLYFFKPGYAKVDCKLYIKPEDSASKRSSNKSF